MKFAVYINSIKYYYIILFSNNKIKNHSIYNNIKYKFLFAAKRIKIF